MIFLTVGASFPFDRLVKYIDQEVAPVLNEEIVAQIHYSARYIPRNMKFFKMLNKEDYEGFIKKATIVISHAGLGTIIDCIEYQKNIILVPRDPEKGEHIDGHQYEICRYIEENHPDVYILWNFLQLHHYILNLIEGKTISVISKDNKNLEKLKENIQNYFNIIGEKSKILIVCEPGGHFRQIQEIIDIFPIDKTLLVTYQTNTTLENYEMHIIENCAPIVTKSTKIDFLKFLLRVFKEAIKLIKEYKPDIILTNGGGGLAVPFSYVGKIFGSKIVFLETVSRVDSKSSSAKIIYPIANKFLIQWEKNLSKYGSKAEYWGSVI